MSELSEWTWIYFTERLGITLVGILFVIFVPLTIGQRVIPDDNILAWLVGFLIIVEFILTVVLLSLFLSSLWKSAKKEATKELKERRRK